MKLKIVIVRTVIVRVVSRHMPIKLLCLLKGVFEKFIVYLPYSSGVECCWYYNGGKLLRT